MLFKKEKGFTIIELIVIITILAILISFALPHFFTVIEKAKVRTDLSNLRILNNSTSYYRLLSSQTIGEDLFQGISENEERMQVLVNKGYLKSAINTQMRNTEFYWHIDSQRWLYSLYALAENSLARYLFKNMSKDSFTFNSWGGASGTGSTWSINEEGLFTTGALNNDLLFIGNDRTEYTLKTNFRLNENPGENGGLGIFFETIINKENDNRDTGYILQFDRGFSEIVLRKRIDGTESNASDRLLVRIGNRSTSTIKNENIPYKTNSSWWESDKEISISVRESASTGIKLLSVSLDGETILSDFEIESDIQAANNHTGFRAWNEGSATIYELTVE